MEDDTKIREHLLSYIKDSPGFEYRGYFISAAEIQDFLLKKPVRLLTADILLPDIKGMEMVESLSKKPLVVFITGHNSKKIEMGSYEFDTTPYLAKSKPYYSLARHITFGTGAVKQRVLPMDIRYIEVKGNETTIHLGNDEKVSFRQTLKEVSDMLPAAYFLQVHKSYIISLCHLRKLGPNFVTFFGTDAVVPVSRSYRAELRARFPDDPQV